MPHTKITNFSTAVYRDFANSKLFLCEKAFRMLSNLQPYGTMAKFLKATSDPQILQRATTMHCGIIQLFTLTDGAEWSIQGQGKTTTDLKILGTGNMEDASICLKASS